MRRQFRARLPRRKDGLAERLQRIADQIPVALWIYDPQIAKLVYQNELSRHLARVLLGNEFDKISTFMEHLHPNDRPTFEQALQRQTIGHGMNQELRIIGAGGFQNWISIRTFPIQDPSGSTTYIVGATEDIGERKSSEQEMRANEERFELTQMAASVCTWEWDFSNAKITFSGAVSSIFGPKGRQTYQDWERAIHPDDVERVREAIAHTIKGSGEHGVEFRYIWEDGSAHWLMARGRLFRGPKGEPKTMLGITIDISERKRIEEELARSKAASEEANRAKSAFLANMSHEIRTPLGVILGYSALLDKTGFDSAERAQLVMTITKSGRQLSQLIDDILDISKVEANRLAVERLEVSLPQLFCEVSAMLEFKAKEKGLELIFRALGRIPATIESDPMRLRQILINVVDNAIKFTHRGRVEVTVRYERPSDGEGQIIFDVSDTGCGIAPAQRSALFRPFSQADSSTTRKFGGTGLGLALSRRLANLLGGDVVLSRSEPGAGSTFTIFVQVGKAGALVSLEDAKESVDQKPSHLEPAALRLQGIDILVVDDAPDNQFLISHFLKAEGARVELASDGVEALEKAHAREFDVILMDIQMPTLDGYDATRQLRGEGYRRPILALTAHAMQEERAKCLAAGCDDHLTKPVQCEMLVSAIERFTGAGAPG